MTAAEVAGTSGWGLLLDRLEERLRLIEASAAPTTRTTAGAAVELGPPPGPDDVPAVAPTESERLRLLTLNAAHEQLVTRLEGRRRALRQAEQYRRASA